MCLSWAIYLLVQTTVTVKLGPFARAGQLHCIWELSLMAMRVNQVPRKSNLNGLMSHYVHYMEELPKVTGLDCYSSALECSA